MWVFFVISFILRVLFGVGIAWGIYRKHWDLVILSVLMWLETMMLPLNIIIKIIGII